MGKALGIGSVVVLSIIIIVMTSYMVDTSRKIKVGNDVNQEKALRYIKYAYTVGWISLAVVIIGGLLFSFFEDRSPFLAWLALFLIFGVFLAYGILTSIAAVSLKKGADYHANKHYYVRLLWTLGICYIIALFALISLIHEFMDRKRGKRQSTPVEDNSDKELQQLESVVLTERAKRYGLTQGRIDAASNVLSLLEQSGIAGKVPNTGGAGI